MVEVAAGKKSLGLSKIAVLSSLCSLALCSFFITITIINSSSVERLQTEQLIQEKSLSINLVVSKMLYDTNKTAPYIIDEPAILDILNAASLDSLTAQGFAYELWRINPYTNERQVIAGNYELIKPSTSYIEKYISVIGADWYLKVWPINMWYNHPENIALIIAGFLISFLVLFIMQNNVELKQMRNVLDYMAKSDPLTGIFNRRHFMEIANMIIEKARRQNEDCYIILFDIDKFKSVNDNYGHMIGDKVLIEVSSRIKANIRPYDLFARYGGEEFIILASEPDKNGILEITERLRLSICNKLFEYEDRSLTVSASFGIACIKDHNIEKAILHADSALYTAKKTGRNRIVYSDEP